MNRSTIETSIKKVSTVHEYSREIRVTHLFISVIISIGAGLWLDLISAWKSGKKPSAISDANNSTIPKIYVEFYESLRLGSATLKIMIPTVISIPTIIFFLPNFSFLFLTREQSTPTKITESTLHDLNIITTGKLVKYMA